MDKFKYVLWWLLANTQGGENRAKIITEIFKKPCNSHELCKLLNVNYKTVRYHLDVLEKNGILMTVGEKYGKTYFPSENLLELKEYFYEIWEKFVKKIDKQEESYHR